MIITDVNNYWHVKNGRCTVCDEPLTMPYVVWMWANVDIFVCSVCCKVDGPTMGHDMRRVATARELQRMGFLEGARRAVVSGGFLIKETTTTEQ